MTIEEQKHNLAVLVEVKLYKILQVIKELSSLPKDIEKEEQKAIIEFINSLPDTYKNMQERDKIIAEVLSGMGVKTNWVTKKIEEASFKIQIKDNDNTIAKKSKSNKNSQR